MYIVDLQQKKKEKRKGSAQLTRVRAAETGCFREERMSSLDGK